LITRRITVQRQSAVLAAAVAGLLVLARAQAQSPAEPQASPAPGSTPAAAPVAPAPPATPVRPSPLAMRSFSLRYRSMDDAYRVIGPQIGARGSVKMQPGQRTLTIQDAPENLQRIASLLASYDVPPRNVQVLVQLIMASAGAAQREPAPPPIRGVIDRLSALSTRWTDYTMVGNAQILGTEGERSSLKVGDDYKVDFKIDQVSDETRVIRFKPFELLRREPVADGPERYASVVNTVLNLRDSQLFIVGASKAEQSNRALFMTVTASQKRP
jgi:hypothetical protein